MLSLEKAAVRLFGPGGRLPGSSTTFVLSPNNDPETGIIGKRAIKSKQYLESRAQARFFMFHECAQSETLMLESRVQQFHTAVDERFAFLSDQGFRIADRASYADRFGRVQLERGATQVYLSWDSFAGGELEAKVNGANLWPFVVAEGLWDAGRYQSVYMGLAIEAMQHGLDRIAAVLRAHPEILSAK